MALRSELLSLALGGAIGILLGALGGGGSVLAVPALVYALGQKTHEATTESLILVGAAAWIGGLDYARRGRVSPRVAISFGAAGAIGAVPGSFANRALPDHALLVSFSILLVVAGVAMLRADPSARPGRHELVAAAVGLATGFVTGLLGVGGGFLVVPALVVLVGLPMALAVGTSLVIIGITSAAALAVHLTHGAVDWAVTAPFTAAAIVGALVGSTAGRSLDQRLARRLFAGLAFVVALGVSVTLSVQGVEQDGTRHGGGPSRGLAPASAGLTWSRLPRASPGVGRGRGADVLSAQRPGPVV